MAKLNRKSFCLDIICGLKVDKSPEMNKIMKPILLIIAFFILTPAISIAQTSESGAIGQALKTGNAKELSRFFSPNVELKILSKEDVYSKTQAEIILRDFFSKNPPSGYSSVHNGTSKAGAQYTIGQLVTPNGTFRTYYFLKKSGDTFLIQELRLEQE
ncbi:MAG: DUF4783 domain-containing protein [Bacteroidetes bacterium]|nr:DUF4783 domain-containing protein [Bacteroidota bacterium]